MRRGFTLVELLVVVTIIVVLLALLVPAMDQAVYQAELAVCGSQMRGAVAGVLKYATEHRRLYPPRTPVLAHIFKESSSFGGQDDRPVLRGYVQLEMLVDPLGSGPLDVSMEGVRPETRLILQRDVWWGFRYFHPQMGGMKRLGDRITYMNNSYSVLINDLEIANAWAPFLEAGHPNREGTLRPVFANNGIGVEQAFTQSVATWWGNPPPPWNRGTMDLNTGFEDGSVRRYDNLRSPPVNTLQDLGDYPLRPLPGGPGAQPDTPADHWVGAG